MAKGQKRSNRETRIPKGEGSARDESWLKSHSQSRPTMSAYPEPEPCEAELSRYGIERVPSDVFRWRYYRYTHARDALAAAKHAEKA